MSKHNSPSIPFEECLTPDDLSAENTISTKPSAESCSFHRGAVHGSEAEELRSGIEALIKTDLRVDSHTLQRLLDSVDARDSLAYLERSDELILLRARVDEFESALARNSPIQAGVHHGLDTDAIVCFYEQEFYPLSNFSAFSLQWKKLEFNWEKFPGAANADLRFSIRTAPSAHVAFQIAQENKTKKRPDWDDVKIDIMRNILRAKVDQHPYVRKKLLETGVRRLVENSWRDDFWGWGERRDGKNMLGALWMEVRAEILADGLRTPPPQCVHNECAIRERCTYPTACRRTDGFTGGRDHESR